MHPYLPHTEEEIKIMLKRIGVETIEELFRDIPQSIRMDQDLEIDDSKSELEITRRIRGLAGRNQNTNQYVCLIGAGAYDHWIPSAIPAIVSRSEFSTAYTPYQPEISQGILQAIFEFQSMICEITGMDGANASVYDGATATAEACFMARAATRKNHYLLAETMNPRVLDVVTTYTRNRGDSYSIIPSKEGVTDIEQLSHALNGDVAAFVVQSPNYYGLVEEVKQASALVHSNKALLIHNSDPIAMGLLASSRDLDADIAVGEGQVLGNPLSYGGPYLGYMATTQKLIRKLPGRIVGQTKDLDGNRGYVLTLQAREQHIRREKATSNITSNEALNALAATVYLSLLGPIGLQEVASRCVDGSVYLAERLKALPGITLAYNQPFFREFLIEVPKKAELLRKQLMEKGYLVSLNEIDSDANQLLIAVTEKRTRKELDDFVAVMEGLL